VYSFRNSLPASPILVFLTMESFGAGYNQPENGDATGYSGIEKDVRIEKGLNR